MTYDFVVHSNDGERRKMDIFSWTLSAEVKGKLEITMKLTTQEVVSRQRDILELIVV